MALRAGYYGLKRRIRNKMFNLLDAVPEGIGPDNPIASKSDVLTAVDLLDDTVGWISKNKADSSKGTVSGTNIFTYNSADKTVTANGTGGANNSQYSIPIDVSGDFYFLGCPEGGGDTKYDVYIYDNTVGERVKQWDGVTQSLSNYGNTPCQARIPQYHSVVMTLRVFAEHEVNNIVFKPMLITKKDYDLLPAYTPQHASVAKILEPIAYNTYKAINSGIVSESVSVRAVRNIGGIQIHVDFTVGENDISSWSNLIQFEPVLKNGVSMRDTVEAIRDVTDETLSAIKLVTITQENWIASNNTFKAGHRYQFNFTYLSSEAITSLTRLSSIQDPETREASDPEPTTKKATKKSTAKAD